MCAARLIENFNWSRQWISCRFAFTTKCAATAMTYGAEQHCRNNITKVRAVGIKKSAKGTAFVAI